ncbi:RNA polymerase sigma factor [Nocardioides sp. MH1]|uniref:RNA polymerase sigma factor n=1 Tax=Nocardioides sp. MH1 TaxID=3242490 RepID=UPI003521F129
MTASDALLATTIREESGRLVAALSRRFGDFDVAEEAVQGAVVEAVRSWRRDGAPRNPAAWLTTAAQRNALDLLRARGRQTRAADRLAASGSSPVGNAIDDRIPLLFACCHPALAPEARLALTLRAVIGLTTPQIARAFLVNEQTLAQRIVRAKRKIVATGIRLKVPDDLDDRLPDVLAVVYLAYNEAFVASSGGTHDRDLGADAAWLAEVVAASLPAQAEAWGLAALLRIQHGRAAARFTAYGDLVLLRDQDRSLWDAGAIKRAGEHLERAASLHSPGRYQLQAAIAMCHAEAPSWEETDWLQIVTLYGFLIVEDPSPVVRLNGAIALAQLGPDQAGVALADIERLAPDLDGYHLWHATRAELLRLLGRDAEAAAADQRALALTANEAERRLIQTRLRKHPLIDGS